MSRPGLLLFHPYMEYMAGQAASHFDLVKAWEADEVTQVIADRGASVVAILTMGQDYPIDDSLFDRLPNLKLIVAVGAGYSCVDVPRARARGIRATNAGDTHSADCADHAIALAMALNRKVVEYDRYVRDGLWGQNGYPQHSRAFSAERVGILGLGRIGRAIADRLAGFGVELAWWGPNAKDAPWPRMETPRELAAWSTMLIVAARGDALGLVDRELMDAVGPDGYIINISRGGVLDEDSLIEALKEGRLAGAGLDVFREEPTAPERWRNVPNVILSPHMAGQTVEAMARLRVAAARNLEAALTGGPVLNELTS